DPLDPCDYKPESVTLPQSGDYLTADCDGDGVPNEKEKEDGTDPHDPCDFKLDSQSVPPSSTWNDRKSTRLNSSYVKISYAVTCLQNTSDNKRESESPP